MSKSNGRIQPLQLTRWIVAWLTLLEGIAGVISLGYWHPYLVLAFSFWDMRIK